jgi:hypothetical protein
MLTDLEKKIRVEGVNFREKLTVMTWSAISAIRERKVKIHTSFTDLTNQLKMVTFNDKGHPDKTRLSFDLGDAFIMAMDWLDGISSGVGFAYQPPEDVYAPYTRAELPKGSESWAYQPPD